MLIMAECKKFLNKYSILNSKINFNNANFNINFFGILHTFLDKNCSVFYDVHKKSHQDNQAGKK